MKLYLLLTTFALSVATISIADTMQVGSKSYRGSLRGYENGKFIFYTTAGKTLKKPRTNVKKFTADTPYKVSYTEKGVTHKAELTKYEKSKFFFKSKGKAETTVYGGALKNIKIEARSSIDMPPGRAPRDTGLKTDLNLKELVAAGDLSVTQKTAINRYIKARKAYIQFQKESGELVAKRDAAKGKSREKIIMQLHQRKNAEQPYMNEVRASVKELEREFPQ